MSKTPELTTPTEYDEPLAEPKRVAPSSLWQGVALGGVMLISLFMNFFKLGQNGFGSYYPPAIRSMMDNWHNFFFASYDPGGFVTIDKPPVGFWLQVISAKIFGFNAVSVLLPQALAGVLSVLLLYYLVRRHFGVVAGLLAALALAISPISVVTNRNATIDSTLALTLLVGAWAVIRAAETGKLRWLLLSAALVGVGFNIKMLEAYLVVPAYGLLYLLAAPRSIWKRIGHLALAGLVLLVVSFSWVVAVDLTPASQRPYVDSTQDNSELSLALGWNGIERLSGGMSGAGGVKGGPPPNVSTDATNSPENPLGTGTPSTNGAPSTNGNGGPANFGGEPTGQRPGGTGGSGAIHGSLEGSPLRLFDVQLGSQASWLLPLALLGMLALAWQGRPRFRQDRRQQSLLLWGMWLLTMGVCFSVATLYHEYYLTVMAPAIAALFGIGLVTMWQDYRQQGWRGWLLPLALVATVAEQLYLLHAYPAWGQWMIPLLVVPSTLAVGVLVGARLAPRLRLTAPGVRFLVPALAAGVLALMLAPAVWAAIPILQGTESDLPLAGPSLKVMGGIGNGHTSADPALVRYLEANQGHAKFLVAVPSSGMADAIILATNRPVMSLGGFLGSDPILTTSQLAALVKRGTVRFFLLNSSGGSQQPPQQILNQLPQQFRSRMQQSGFAGPGGTQSTLTAWVTQHCKTVPTSLWQSSATSAGTGPFGSGAANQLYDCAAAH